MLDVVQLRAVSSEVIEREELGMLLSPAAVRAGLVVFGVIGNGRRASTGSGTSRLQVLQEPPAGEGVELIRLVSQEGLNIAQANGAEIPDTAPGGINKE